MTILWAEMVFLTKAASDESADDTQQRDAAITKIDAIKIFTAIEAQVCVCLFTTAIVSVMPQQNRY